MNKIWLVAKETYRREVKTWSYLLMILAPFLLVFFSFVIGMVSAGGSDAVSYTHLTLPTNIVV